MPINAEQWRAGVGLNNAARSLARSLKHSDNHFDPDMLAIWLSKNKGCIMDTSSSTSNNMDQKIHGHTSNRKMRMCCQLLCAELAFSIVVVAYLLLCSGDIETNPGPTFLTPNDLTKVCRLASGASSMWYNLGLELGVKKSVLDTIKQNNPFDVAACFRSMLSEWLSVAPTVESLVAALEKSHIANIVGTELLWTGIPHNQQAGQNASPEPMDCTPAPACPSCDADAFFKQSIETQVKSLETQFKMISDRVYHKIEATSMTVECLKEQVISSLPAEYRQDNKKFYQQVEESINHCSSASEVWAEFSQYWNYLNFTQLECFIKCCHDCSLSQELCSYLELLDLFCSRTSVCDFSMHWPDSGKRDNKLNVPVCFDLDWEKCTLKSVSELTDSLLLRLSFPKFAVNFEEFSSGYLTTTLSIPKALAFHARKNVLSIASDMAFLKKHRIMTIKFGFGCRMVKYSSVTQYGAYLKDIYSRMKITHKLAPFNLMSLSGHRDHSGDVVYFKDHIQENDVDQSTYRRIVLIEGPPGIGKTTFSEQFCYKWSQGQCLRDHQLLVLVSLRDKRVRSVRKVNDLFQHPQLQEEVAMEVNENEGKGLALWLEAWDELEEDLRKDSSIFLDLLHGRILPEAKIFITSRPWATKVIRESSHERQRVQCCIRIHSPRRLSMKADQHIEMVGSPRIQIDRVLNDRVKTDFRESFLEYVESNPTVKATMHTPLAANMVADVFHWSQDAECIRQITLTQIYAAFTCVLLTKHLSSQSKRPCTIISLEEIPSDKKEQFLNLCRLSWESLVRHELTFSREAVGGETLGLMLEVKELHYEENGQFSYHFLHLTIQEFLSAYHLTQLPAEMQVQLVQKCVDTGHFTMVMHFYLGLSHPHTSTSALSSLRELCSCVVTAALLGQQSLEPEELPDALPGYVPTRLRHSLTRSFIAHRLILRSLTSQHESKSSSIFHWLFETGGARKLPDLLEVRVCSYSWSPIDYYTLGHAISHSGIQWSLEFCNAAMGYEGMKMLCRGLASNSFAGPKGKIVFADFRSNELTPEGVKCLVSVPQQMLLTVKELDLSANGLDSNAVISISKVIPHLVSLQKLSLVLNPMGGDGAMEVLLCLCRCEIPLKTLHLLSIKEDTAAGPGVRPSPTVDHALPLNTLEVLRLDDCLLSEENTKCLASILHQSLWQLKELHVRNCGITSEGVVLLARAITSNHSLTVWEIHGNHTGDLGAAALGDMLKQNATLLKLIPGKGITAEGSVHIVQALTQNETLRELWLGGNAIGVECAKLVGAMLEQNKTLRALELCFDVSLGDGASSIIASLERNTTLRSISLSRKYRCQADPRIQWY